MLGTLPEEFKIEWTNHVNTLTYAHNCTRSNATGFSSYYLLYGWHPLLAIDIELGAMTPDLSETITLKYVKELQRRLEYAFRKANVNANSRRRYKDPKDDMISLQRVPN